MVNQTVEFVPEDIMIKTHNLLSRGYCGLYAFIALCPYQRNQSIGEKKSNHHQGGPHALPIDFMLV